ncbi:40S ribosomal protein S17, partial [Podila minutissima]
MEQTIHRHIGTIEYTTLRICGRGGYCNTGRVRTKTVKKASKVLIEKYYPRLTLDFQTNKKIASEVAIIPSKRLRNKIAGFTTHLMKRIQRGPVR